MRRLGGKTENSYFWIMYFHQSSCGDPIHFLHINIHENDGGFKLSNAHYRFIPITRLTDHFEIGVRFKDAAHDLPKHGMVVDDKYPNVLSYCHHKRFLM